MTTASKDDVIVLERLVRREEVLEICYWYEGEGLGAWCDSEVLGPFLKCDAEAVEAALQELAALGHLAPVPDHPRAFRLTASGKREGAKLFAESFADLQRQGHGECVAGCCEEDDHSRCGEDCAVHAKREAGA